MDNCSRGETRLPGADGGAIHNTLLQGSEAVEVLGEASLSMEPSAR